MYDELALLQPDEHGLITRRAANEAGVDDNELQRMLRTQRLLRIRRGVYVEAAYWNGLDPFRAQPVLRIRAAQRVLLSDHVLSHDSAALIHGMGAPDPRRALVHVTRPKVHGDRERNGVKHHLAPFRDGQVRVVDGFRVLDPARTALDLAREHGLVAGVAGCDAALRLGVTLADLLEARAAMWCWPGSRTMDSAIRMSDPGAESWLESAGRVLVTGLGIGRPQTQFGLRDRGRTVWVDMRVGRHVFEVDGRQKYLPDQVGGRSPEEVLWDEKKRQDFITGFKLGVSRITAVDCHGGWAAARPRLLREFHDTCARFGSDISDLAPYVVTRRR